MCCAAPLCAAYAVLLMILKVKSGRHIGVCKDGSKWGDGMVWYGVIEM